MTFFRLTAGADQDDCSQRASTSSYSSTSQTLITANAATAANVTQSSFGIRFIGDIPSGTAQIPLMSINGYATSGTSATAVPLTIRAQILPNTTAVAAGPNTFKSGTTAGADDLTSASGTSGRTWSTNSTSVSHTTGPSTNFSWAINPDTVKELMISAGAVFAGSNPYIATTATQVPIHNPAFRIDGNLLTAGSSPANIAFQTLPYDTVTAATTANKAVQLLQIPSLQFDSIGIQPLVSGRDKRVHIMLCTDSTGWGLGPSLDPVNVKLPEVRISLGYIAGNLDTTGLLTIKDTTWDTVPAGQPYGGVPRGYATIKDPTSGVWLQITDVYGTLYGKGPLVPEARSGYTSKGVLKDRLIAQLGISPSEAIIHSFVYGGTTVSPVGTTTGVWSSTTAFNKTYTSLSTITDYSNLTGISNPLWSQLFDDTGRNALQVLSDPTIENLLIVYIGGGNDVFSSNFFASGGTMVLPLASNSSTLINAMHDQINQGYIDFFTFCKGVRDFYGTVSTRVHEEHLLGYMNFVTSDPRVPEIVVNAGGPKDNTGTLLADFHAGAYTSITTGLDAWYGGPNGTSLVTGGTATPAMAPFGATAGVTAVTPGTGVANVMPHIPMHLNYGGQNVPVIGSSIPAPVTNMAGGLPIARTSPRAMQKDDLHFTRNLKMANYCYNTFNSEINATGSGSYARWFSHAAADHFGGTVGNPSTLAGWQNARSSFEAALQSNYPKSATNALNLPWDNLNILFSYCTRNITNDNVNQIFRSVVKPAAVSAVATLKTAGHDIKYLDMGNAVGTAYGTGDLASGDLSTTLDGVHLTHSAAIVFNNQYIDRALALNSAMIGKLAAVGLEPMMFAMM